MTRVTPDPGDLVVVYVDGGDHSLAGVDVVCTDLDGGNARGEWSVLIPRHLVDCFLIRTGATQVGKVETWDGSIYGDDGGTVERIGKELSFSDSW